MPVFFAGACVEAGSVVFFAGACIEAGRVVFFIGACVVAGTEADFLVLVGVGFLELESSPTTDDRVGGLYALQHKPIDAFSLNQPIFPQDYSGLVQVP